MLARRLRDNPLELRLAMRCLNDRGVSDALDEMHVFAHYLDGLRAEFKGQHVAELLEVLGAMMLRSRTIRFSRDDLRRECPNLIEPRGSTSALIVLEEEGVVTSLDRRSYTFAVERLAEQIVGEHVAARDEHSKSGRSLAHFAATLVRSKFAQAHGVVQVALDQRIRDCGRDAGDQMLLDFIDGCPPDVAALATLALESRVLEMGEEGAGSLASWMLEHPSESDVEVVIQTSTRLAARGRPQLACALLQPFVTDVRHDAARGPIRHAQLACEYVNCVSQALDSSSEDVDAVELVSQITSCLSHLRERDRAESTGEGLQLLARALLAASSVEAAADGHLDCGALGEEAIAACRRYVAHTLEERSDAKHDDAIRQLSDCLHDVGVGAARRGNDARAEPLLRDALDESARMASEAAWDPSPTHWHLSLIYERRGQHDVRLDHLLKCRDGELARRRWGRAVITCSEIGDALVSIGEVERGIGECKRAIDLADRYASQRHRAVARERLGDTLRKVNRLEEALDAYQHSYETGMNPERIANWYPAVPLADAGDVLGQLGRWDEAIAKHEQAIDTWRQDGDRREVAIGLERLGDVFRKAKRLEEALDAYQQSYDTGMNPERVAYWYPAVPLADAGDVLGLLGRSDEAIARHEEAVGFWQQEGDRRRLANGLERLGDALRQAGRFEEALRVYEQSYDNGMNPERAQDWSPASCLYETARTLTSLKRWDEALAKHHEAIAIQRKDGDRRNLAIGLERLGDTLQEAGRLDEALDAYQQSYETGMNPERIANWYPAVPLADAGDVLGQLGRWDEAIAKHHEAIAARRQDGDRRRLATAIERLGDTLRQAGRFEEALDAYQQSYDTGMNPERATNWYAAVPLADAGDVLGQLGRWDEAIAKHEQAIDTWRQDGDRRGVAIGLERLGDTLRQAGRFEEALDAYQQSYETGMNPERVANWCPAVPLAYACDVLGQLGRWEESIAKHHQAIAIQHEDGDRRKLAIGLERLGDTLRQAGRLEEALDAYQQSYDTGVNPERAEDWSPASCLYETARTLTSLKQWDEAVAKHHEAIAAWQQDGDRRKLAIGLELLGDTLQVAGRLEEALKAYQQSYDKGMNPERVANWYPAVPLADAGDVLGQLGRWDEAVAKHREAIALWQQDGDREDVATALERLGDTLRTAGRHEDAVDAYRKAFDAGTLPEPLDEWDPVGALRKAAEVLIAHGDPHDAVDLLRTAYLRIGATDADGRIDPASDRAIPLSTELARALHASGQTIAALESMHSVRPAAERCCTETTASVELADAAVAWWKLHSELWRALGDDREVVASDRWLQRLNRPRTSQPAAEGD
jgi:tetratricopeptide (TPR) repeat protein